jgi:hypothetical protein
VLELKFLNGRKMLENYASNIATLASW